MRNPLVRLDAGLVLSRLGIAVASLGGVLVSLSFGLFYFAGPSIWTQVPYLVGFVAVAVAVLLYVPGMILVESSAGPAAELRARVLANLRGGLDG